VSVSIFTPPPVQRPAAPAVRHPLQFFVVFPNSFERGSTSPEDFPMSVATSTNGKPQRKQLSEQLDRFDAMLDGLSDGLSEAVADAARAGTRLAVKDAIVEILTDPQLRNQLHQATAPTPEPAERKPGFWESLKARAGRIGEAVRNSVSAAVKAVRRTIGRGCDSLRDPLLALRMLGSMKRLLFLGAGVGTLVTVLSYLAPRELAAAVSGVGAGATAIAVQIAVWLRRTFRPYSVV
jgi:hypothetical protein